MKKITLITLTILVALSSTSCTEAGAKPINDYRDREAQALKEFMGE
jgi:hypothetical protein